jgi:glutaredoxin
MMTLYNLSGCPYCIMVRRRMDELGLAYEVKEVPGPRSLRKEVYEVSGQWTVPVLVDGGKVFDDEDKILAHINATYAAA